MTTYLWSSEHPVVLHSAVRSKMTDMQAHTAVGYVPRRCAAAMSSDLGVYHVVSVFYPAVWREMLF